MKDIIFETVALSRDDDVIMTCCKLIFHTYLNDVNPKSVLGGRPGSKTMVKNTIKKLRTDRYKNFNNPIVVVLVNAICKLNS